MGLLFLSLFLVLVSGVLSEDQGDTVTCFLNQDVILECKCPNKVPGTLEWQTENETNPQGVFPSNHPRFGIQYKDRIGSFPEEHDNCSIRLNNVTLDDSATYRCAFNNETYQRLFVKLHVIPRPEADVIPRPKTESRFGDNPNPSISPPPSRMKFFVIPAVLLLLLVIGYLSLHQRRNSAGTPELV